MVANPNLNSWVAAAAGRLPSLTASNRPRLFPVNDRCQHQLRPNIVPIITSFQCGGEETVNCLEYHVFSVT
jgi:hypothetical protein